MLSPAKDVLWSFLIHTPHFCSLVDSNITSSLAQTRFHESTRVCSSCRKREHTNGFLKALEGFYRKFSSNKKILSRSTYNINQWFPLWVDGILKRVNSIPRSTIKFPALKYYLNQEQKIAFSQSSALSDPVDTYLPSSINII